MATTFGYLRARMCAAGFWLVVLVCRILRIRFLVNSVYPPLFTHIGHLAAEPDCFVKEGLLGLRPWFIGVLLIPRGSAANPCLLNCWRQRLWVVSSPFWVRLLSPLAAVPELQYHTDPYVTAINKTPTFGPIQAAYAGRKPVLHLTRRHRKAGEAVLQRLGMPPGAWFVGIHCREGGFVSADPSKDPAHRATSHRARNASIEGYLPAMKALVERGGWCIRLGDPSMSPLPPIPGVIDYANSPLRSDWMDIFLCSQCRFLLGSASGLCMVASVFGVPCAIANQTSPAIALPYGPGDLFIPKPIFSVPSGEQLTLPEILGGPLGNARFTYCLDLARTTVEDNAPEDIRDLALEMLDELDGTFRETEEDQCLQAEFRALLHPGHYAYGTISRFGRLYLRKHRWLLEKPCGRGLKQDYVVPCCGTAACPCVNQTNWAAKQLCTDPPPVAIREFPRDVIDPAFKSTGILEDGWVAPVAHCTLTQPGDGPFVLRGLLPQVGNRAVSPEVCISVDGQEVLRQVLQPGAVDLCCPVSPSGKPRRIDIRVSPGQKLPAPDSRPVGIHLSYLGFAPPPPNALKEFPRDLEDPAVNSSGIYVDGWVAPTVHCILTQAGDDPLVVRGLLPQVGAWPITPEVLIRVDGREVLREVLHPGSIELTCPVEAAPAARRVEVHFSHTQKLPAPDSRSVGMHLSYLGFAKAA
jgi:putative glycosyltransferase (TIGR04372 family)